MGDGDAKAYAKRQRKRSFELAMYVLAAVCFVYYLIKGIAPKMWQALLIAAVLLLIRVVVKLTKTTMFAALRFCVLLFILSQCFGK